MSYMVCHMSLFLRAGHLGHLKNSSNLPSPGPQEEWDVPQRDTPAVGSLAQGGPSALLQARCSLCPLCPSTLPPRLLSCVSLSRSGPVYQLMYSLSWATAGDQSTQATGGNHQHHLAFASHSFLSVGSHPPLSLCRSCSGLLATQATRL